MLASHDWSSHCLQRKFWRSHVQCLCHVDAGLWHCWRTRIQPTRRCELGIWLCGVSWNSQLPIRSSPLGYQALFAASLPSNPRCTASWSWHPELTVQQPCFVNTTVTQGTDSEQVVFISMCDNKLFVEWHEVLKVYALEKNWGNCTPHHPMFAFVSVICSTLRSMEMASVIGLVFDLRIWSIEVGRNWSPFHTMALRFLSLQQHLLTLGACPR